MQRSMAACTSVACFILAGVPAVADEVADFYIGRTITITAASGIGGGYGLYAQLVGEHLAKYVPGNPNVIVNFNPAASGLAAVEHSYNIAPKDGDRKSVV